VRHVSLLPFLKNEPLDSPGEGRGLAFRQTQGPELRPRGSRLTLSRACLPCFKGGGSPGRTGEKKELTSKKCSVKVCEKFNLSLVKT